MLGSVLVFLFIAFAYLTGRIADFFLGEEYYVLSNAAVYPHTDAWVKYFLANGRLLEGIYWTYLYELVDFSPAIIHSFSLILLYLGSLLGAIAVSRVWPNKQHRAAVAFALLLLFFFGPFSMNWVSKLSGDNSRIALIFFWLGAWCLQQWVISGFRKRYLFGSLLLHMLSLLSYENAAFFYPASVLLTLPLLPSSELGFKGKRLRQLGILALASLFLLFIPYGLYLLIDQFPGVFLAHYAATGGGVIARLLNFIPGFWILLTDLGRSEVMQRSTWALAYLVAVIVLVAALLFGNARVKKTRPPELRYPSLFSAAVWIFIAGLAIWSFLVTEAAPTRAYVAAMVSFPILLVLLFEHVPPTAIWKLGAVLVMAAWVWMGVVEFESESKENSAMEAQYSGYLLSIHGLVPDVRPGTWFVLVDFDLGNTGCGPSLSMLYEVADLFCARLSSKDPGYVADRYAGDLLNVRNTGGWIRNGNMIILGIDREGRMYIIPSISSEDDLYINWYSSDPIRTDFRRVISGSSKTPSTMALKLMERQKALEPNAE